MNNKQDFTSDQLRINKSSAHPKIKAARLFQDVQKAAAIGRLSYAVLDRSISEIIHFNAHGTFVTLATVEPLLEAMGCGGTAPLTGLIPRVNALLLERAKSIQGAANPSAALARSDKAFDDLGFSRLRQALIDLARKEARELLIEDASGAGGILSIPPRPMLVVPNAASRSRKDGSEIVTRVVELTELVSHAGAAYVLPSGQVDDGVCVGSPARLLHPRSNSVRWRIVHSISRVAASKETTP